MVLFDDKPREKDQLVKVVDTKAKTRLSFGCLQRFLAIEKPMEIMMVVNESAACLYEVKSAHPSILSQRNFQHFSYYPNLFVWENLR